MADTSYVALPDINMGGQVMQITTYHPFKSEQAKERYLKFYDTQANKWPVDSETRTVNTSYGQTFMRISGPINAQPLVLIPGLSASSLMWIPNIKALSEYYRTYALDHIYDNGRSVYTRPIASPDDFVKWLDELVNSLEFEKSINLMGISFGGWLTSHYALHFPDRLNKIVLLTPTCTVLPVGLSFYIHGALTPLPLRYFTKHMFFWLFEDCVRKDEISRMRLEEWIDNMFIAYRCFKMKRPFNPPVMEDQELRSIKVPTLYLVGENEKLYSAKKAVHRLNQAAPQIITEIIPDAGHDMTIVQAEMVNRKVLDFLK
jgi:pimeloyl-ACP methyl ester carboxylesterase